MWSFLFTFSIVPIALALLARWWFALRVLSSDGVRPCRCDLAKWLPAPGDKSEVHRAEQPAAAFGAQFLEKALSTWKAADPKGHASRDNALRFGLAAPPLSVVVAILAVAAAKIPVIGALSIPLAAIALAVLFGVMALPAELAAIQRSARKLREEKAFPDRDDEDAVVRCASALAWERTIPPLLRWLQKQTG